LFIIDLTDHTATLKPLRIRSFTLGEKAEKQGFFSTITSSGQIPPTVHMDINMQA
jgi:hypothetical protein